MHDINGPRLKPGNLDPHLSVLGVAGQGMTEDLLDGIVPVLDGPADSGFLLQPRFLSYLVGLLGLALLLSLSARLPGLTLLLQSRDHATQVLIIRLGNPAVN